MFWFSDRFVFTINKAKRGFGLLAPAAKPSEAGVVHLGDHPFQYKLSPLLLDLSDEMGTHHTSSQFMKVRRQLKKKKRKKTPPKKR